MSTCRPSRSARLFCHHGELEQSRDIEVLLTTLSSRIQCKAACSRSVDVRSCLTSSHLREINGGSCIAMLGDRCVAIACDLRLGNQALTITCDFEKVCRLHKHSAFSSRPSLIVPMQSPGLSNYPSHIRWIPRAGDRYTDSVRLLSSFSHADLTLLTRLVQLRKAT